MPRYTPAQQYAASSSYHSSRPGVRHSGGGQMPGAKGKGGSGGYLAGPTGGLSIAGMNPQPGAMYQASRAMSPVAGMDRTVAEAQPSTMVPQIPEVQQMQQAQQGQGGKGRPAGKGK